MEGLILGNRYELMEKIGGGGMAVVYKAKCSLLNRFVAVKILRQDFTNDEEFVKRFRIEAQSAASLSHPNIVSIYDVGHEGEIHYIVMEYVDGTTLKEYITQKGAIGWREALNISIQICSAIEHAHRNNIVHRDIKPHNILLTKDRIVKVTDFGIARAVSSSTITMVGSTIGSVHYFSPEQARGGFIDEKSDLYSIGVTLYEMVTGRVPFDGETPVAVALKHIQLEAQPPLEINQDIPLGVNNIIIKAMKKEQNKRYQTASELLEDLYMVLKNPDSEIHLSEEPDDESPTRRMQALSKENIGLKDEYLMKEKGKEKEKKKGDRLTFWLAVLTSVLIISVFMYATYKFIVQPTNENNPSEFIVGNYIGKSLNDVKFELARVGIDVRETRRFDDKVAKDVIITQVPDAGKKFKLPGYNFIALEVSNGPNVVKMEDLRKIDYRTALDRIRDLNLEARVEEEFSSDIAIGLVIKTEPGPREEVKVGSIVTVYKSKGPELKTVKVPSLVGKNKSEALKALSDTKLAIGKMTPEDNISSTAKVTKQDPAAGKEVNEETAVNITFEVTESGQRRYINTLINLNNPSDFGVKFTVRIEVVPADTKKPEIIMNEARNKAEFPISVPIPVSDKGQTDVSFFIDNKLIQTFQQSLPGRN